MLDSAVAGLDCENDCTMEAMRIYDSKQHFFPSMDYFFQFLLAKLKKNTDLSNTSPWVLPKCCDRGWSAQKSFTVIGKTH